MKPAISNEKMKAYFKTERGKACIKACRPIGYNTIEKHLRRIFSAMRQRCTCKNNPQYPRYGGRGIKLCFTVDEFINYVMNILQVDPRELDCDRINNDGNYERGNIRFVTHKINCNNLKGTKMKLPKEVKIPTKVIIDDEDGNCSAVADYLSDIYGFCVISLNIENGMATDIVWDMTD